MIHTYINTITNKIEINVTSEMNDWMDATFTIINDKDWRKAHETLKKAWDAYWDDPEAEDQCYGDWLENAMQEAGIEYEVTYANDNEDDEDGSDECWDTVVARELDKEERA